MPGALPCGSSQMLGINTPRHCRPSGRSKVAFGFRPSHLGSSRPRRAYAQLRCARVLVNRSAIYSSDDGSAPASGTLCLSHGGRKSRHSSLCRLSQRCDRQLRRPTRDRDTSIGGWGWGSKGGSGYAQSSVLLSQLPQGLLDLAHRIKQHCSYRLGLRESSEIRRATRQH